MIAYFNTYGFNIEAIEKALDRYYVMYFEDIAEKNFVIEEYNRYQTVRKREFKKLRFNDYRLYADMSYIKDFINDICTVNYFNIPGE